MHKYQQKSHVPQIESVVKERHFLREMIHTHATGTQRKRPSEKQTQKAQTLISSRGVEILKSLKNFPPLLWSWSIWRQDGWLVQSCGVPCLHPALNSLSRSMSKGLAGGREKNARILSHQKFEKDVGHLGDLPPLLSISTPLLICVPAGYRSNY